MFINPYVSLGALDKVNIVSWNVRGLNSKFKRATVFQYIKQHKQHILLLQETHMLGNKVIARKKTWVAWAIHSTYLNYARGVSIMIAKSFQAEISLIKKEGL